METNLGLLLLLPWVVQGVVMMVDEFVFHFRRGLPLWERLGHPLDTLTVILSIGWLFLTEPNPVNLKVYLFLSVFSCLFITKDEWVHHEKCGPTEQWLHALLFVLHPICLLSAGILWWEGLSRLLKIQLSLLVIFLTYQIIYWNYLWKPLKRLHPDKSLSIMPSTIP